MTGHDRGAHTSVTMDAPNAKRFAFIGKFGLPAQQTAIAATIPPKQATSTIAQTLPEVIFRSAAGRACDFVMPILTKATDGALMSFRNGQGTVPGPPFTFAYPNIEFNSDCRPAFGFGFMGFLELSLTGSANAGTVGTILTTAPSVKIVGNNVYPEAEKATLIEQEASGLPMADIGPAWQDLQIAKAPLVVNTEAFFRTQKFERVVQMATMDKSFGTNAASFSLTKSRLELECISTATSGCSFAPSLSRYVLLLNPPKDATFGVRVTSVTGGTVTDRGTTRPFKVVFAHAAKPTLIQEVTLWPSDASAIFGKAPDLGACIKTASAILLIGGAPSDNEKGVEFTVRAGCMAVDESHFLAISADAIKALFNDIAHDPSLEQSGRNKMSYAKSIDAVLAKGRAVPLVVRRASHTDVILVKKAVVVELVRSAAKVDPEDDEATKDMASSVSNSTDEQLVAAIELMDKAVAKAGDVDNARDELCKQIEEEEDYSFTDLQPVKAALVALSVVAALDPQRALELAAMVKRSPAPAVESAEEEDAENLVPEQEEEEGEEEDDLCFGL